MVPQLQEAVTISNRAPDRDPRRRSETVPGGPGGLAVGAARACALAFVGLLALALLYALSIGPAALVLDHHAPSLRSAARSFYRPLGWIHDKTPLREPLEWYVDLFVVRGRLRSRAPSTS